MYYCRSVLIGRSLGIVRYTQLKEQFEALCCPRPISKITVTTEVLFRRISLESSCQHNVLRNGHGGNFDTNICFVAILSHFGVSKQSSQQHQRATTYRFAPNN